MQDKLGRFIKGTHWRKSQPFWKKEWLENEYINKKQSANDIAKKFNVGDTAILFWLKKHRIKTRSISETRIVKKWGLKGEKNGMYGRTGKANPNWNGGHSPERQSLYARAVWKELAKSILKRDNYLCQKCGGKHTTKVRLVVHHIKPWAKYPKLRFEPKNLLTLCKLCHRKIHSKKL